MCIKDDSLTTKLSKEDFLGRSGMLSKRKLFLHGILAQTFYTDDIVTHNGRNYRAVQDSQGVTPSEDAVDNWAATTQGSGLEYASHRDEYTSPDGGYYF